jgi:hypothetical protein
MYNYRNEQTEGVLKYTILNNDLESLKILSYTHYHDHAGTLPNSSTTSKECHYKHNASYGNQ